MLRDKNKWPFKEVNTLQAKIIFSKRFFSVEGEIIISGGLGFLI